MQFIVNELKYILLFNCYILYLYYVLFVNFLEQPIHFYILYKPWWLI